MPSKYEDEPSIEMSIKELLKFKKKLRRELQRVEALIMLKKLKNEEPTRRGTNKSMKGGRRR